MRFVALLLLAACVPKGRYVEATAESARVAAERDALQTELRRSQSDADAARAELDATRSVLDSTNRRLAEAVAQAGSLEADVARMTSALAEAEERKARADAALAEYRDLVARFQALIDSGTLSVKVVGGRMIVELATDVLFPPGSATLSREGRQAITEVAAVLSSIERREYQVAGHTDNVPIASDRFPSNWHLGSARAIAVVDVLVESGLAMDRVSAASFAETKPAGTNRTPEGRAANRRIEIVIVPDLSQLPGYDELAALGGSPVTP